jgi:DNA-directed RNA polymerase subunit RPC12/RpoP
MPYFSHDISCPSCGYNLRGLSLYIGCPECGLKVVSNSLKEDEDAHIKQIEAEVGENLRLQEEMEARNKCAEELIAIWQRRGERFDQLLDQLESVLSRLGEKH